MSCQLHILNSAKTSLLVPRASVLGHSKKTFLPAKSLSYPRRKRANENKISASSNNREVEQLSTAATAEKSYKVKAETTVIITIGGNLSNLSLNRGLDDIHDLLGKTFRLELVSSELDHDTGLEKETIKAYGHRTSQHGDNVKFECEFIVPEDFGEVGAVLVENEHHKEMYFKDIVLKGFPFGDVNVTCNSWVHSVYDNPSKRIFFTSKSYLPSETPDGLRRLREQELANLRGTGVGQRRTYDRIYDYDIYNDLGDPDKSPELARPVIGGKEFPYPRRCRTGRPHTKKDPLSERRSSNVYVPRDEAFSEVKQMQFSAKTVRSVVHCLLPQIETSLIDATLGFPYFHAIDALFNEGVPMEKIKDVGIFKTILPRLVKAITDEEKELLRFEIPEMHNRDKFSWFRDEEFARQTLAGLNPYSIQLVTEWPLRSKLEPEIYGPAESLITTELVEQVIGGEISVESALKDKRLFILDYHDIYMPYVNKVRELPGTTLYGSRTLFFLTRNGTLRPIAIELTRPPVDDKPQWKEVFTPGWDASGCWLWRLAKAHVCAHDAGFHQLVHHWLRTHCCTEPYIIATNRQLSAMHPVYRLLHPHFRYTMEINALARESLINAGGIIESCFSSGKYSIELSSVAYDKLWRFDMEALPTDLIRRYANFTERCSYRSLPLMRKKAGLAVEDPTAEHGLKLTIEDYPFANDGLILWDAIKQWVSDYVNHYYPGPTVVQTDKELQAWWTEIRIKGHADKKDEPWWPVLNTPKDLVHVLTTIIWVTSGHHAAVNFGQYMYGGYFPNRPTVVRTKMPVEDPTPGGFQRFLERPERELLKCFPSQVQATKIMAVLDVLSGHSPDEEYLGEKMEPVFEENPVIKVAFEKFNWRLKQLEGIIDERNANLNLRNRSGAGVVPYELLKPFSEAGVTGKGIPNSISI